MVGFASFCLCLLAVAAVGTIAYVEFHDASSRSTEAVSPPPKQIDTFGRDQASVLNRGQMLLDAIYRFHAEIGLWPEKLADLHTNYLSQEYTDGWEYNLHSPSSFTLRCFARFPRELISFRRRSTDDSGWGSETDLGYVPFKERPPLPQPRPIPEEERLVNFSREINRRIQRDPKEIHPRQVKVSWLVRHGRLDEAQRACEMCVKDFPRHWWPHLALAMVRYRKGDTTLAEQGLQEVVSQHRDFCYYYYLFRFYQDAGLETKALESLVKGTGFPVIIVDKNNEHLVSSNAWNAAAYAYAKAEYRLVIAICDQWQRYEEKQRTGWT
jgi:hypothetical protein